MRTYKIIEFNSYASMIMFCFSSLAYSYDYHPNARLYLGGGFDPRKIDQGFAPCLENTASDNDFEGPGPAHLHIQYVRSEADIHKRIGFSTFLAGSYLFGSGRVTHNFSNENSFSSDSITFVIYANAHFGRQYISNPRIKDELRALPYEQLLRLCGPEIVTERTLGSSIVGVFTLYNVSEADRTQFDTAVGGALNGGIFNSSVEASISGFISTIATTIRLSVSIYSIGGGGIASLSGLLPNGNETIGQRISDAPSVMRNYISQMTRENAAPISFTTMHLNQLSGANVPTQETFDNLALVRIYERYVSVNNIVNRLERILFDHDPEYLELTDERRQQLIGNYEAYEQARDALQIEGRNCFTPSVNRPVSKLSSILLTLPKVTWPERRAIAVASAVGAAASTSIDEKKEADRIRNIGDNICIEETLVRLKEWSKTRPTYLAHNFGSIVPNATKFMNDGSHAYSKFYNDCLKRNNVSSYTPSEANLLRVFEIIF